ncbi:MAG TPA: hypothetical protein VGB75_11875 [Jatrophihabitans sp.]|jgi:hypothetical protein|uniref:hypothetical protein n=1 Tax=Jatrophihabitans sp. TaxID=1932789 RepID=UPI002F0CFB8E
MNQTDARWDPAPLVSRGLGWGAIAGGALGALYWTVASIGSRAAAAVPWAVMSSLGRNRRRTGNGNGAGVTA